MISALRSFDKITAAGILARAALAIYENPASTIHLVPNEKAVREAVISEAITQLGTSFDELSSESREKLTDILDSERDLLIAPLDTKQIFKRLSNRGTLPSDLFEINIVRTISEFHLGKFLREEKLIQETIRTPDIEQQFGPPETADQPFLISLFAKHFPDKFPMKSFTMLVACKRNGLTLDVHQAWRLYPDIAMAGVNSLVDMLERFSDRFGVEIEVEGVRGHFILAATLTENKPITTVVNTDLGEPLRTGNVEKRQVTVSCFVQPNPLTQMPQAALAVAIDLNKYKRFLVAHGY